MISGSIIAQKIKNKPKFALFADSTIRKSEKKLWGAARRACDISELCMVLCMLFNT